MLPYVLNYAIDFIKPTLYSVREIKRRKSIGKKEIKRRLIGERERKGDYS